MFFSRLLLTSSLCRAFARILQPPFCSIINDEEPIAKIRMLENDKHLYEQITLNIHKRLEMVDVETMLSPEQLLLLIQMTQKGKNDQDCYF